MEHAAKSQSGDEHGTGVRVTLVNLRQQTSHSGAGAGVGVGATVAVWEDIVFKFVLL